MSGGTNTQSSSQRRILPDSAAKPVVASFPATGTISQTVTSGIAKKNGGTPEGARQGVLMLNILEREPDDKVEPTFTDRELKVSRDYLARKISRAEASGQPFAEVVTIGAELAHLLLQRNPADENRKLSQATVEKYAADMAAGRWQGLNGQTIVISKDGYLNDGQHRLNAVIECGGNIPFTVVFGAERETRLTLDQNKVRTSGDYLGMSGIKYPNETAAVATILFAFERNCIGSTVSKVIHHDSRPTKATLHAYALKNMADIERGIEAVKGTAARRLSAPSRIAAALVIISRAANWEDAETFVASVIEGDSLGRSNPAFVARERLLSERLSGTTPVLRTLEILFRAWNAHRRGGRMTKMALNGKLPSVEA